MQLFRAMKRDPDDEKPLCAPSARALGVRLPPADPADIVPDGAGDVHPDAGGMSAAPRPSDLVPWRRPPKFDGIGKEPLWVVEADRLQDPLNAVQDSTTHITVEPSCVMSAVDFQGALCATRNLWSEA